MLLFVAFILAAKSSIVLEHSCCKATLKPPQQATEQGCNKSATSLVSMSSAFVCVLAAYPTID